MDDADVIEERFWAIAREIGPIRPAPVIRIRPRGNALETLMLLVLGPASIAAVCWGVIAVALGL